MIIDENNYKDYLSYDGEALHCTFNGIIEIKYLPESLKRLYCYGNKLTHLPELPKSLKYIDCEDNVNLPYAGVYNSKEQIKQLRKRIDIDLYLLGEI